MLVIPINTQKEPSECGILLLKKSITRDLTWLNKNYAECLENEHNKNISDESDSTIQINKEEDNNSSATKTSKEDSSEPLKDLAVI